MITWGTSFGSHDAALAVFDNESNQLLFASHSERFSRKKDDLDLSKKLVDYALEKFGQPSTVFYYENPWKKRIRYFYSKQYNHIFEPLPGTVLKNLGVNCKVVYTDHHYSHAAAGYYTSKFNDAAIVVIDAIGEMASITIWEAKGEIIKKIYQQNSPIV